MLQATRPRLSIDRTILQRTPKRVNRARGDPVCDPGRARSRRTRARVGHICAWACESSGDWITRVDDEPVYLKRAPWNAPKAAAAVRDRVSALLLEIERGGEDAIRRISTELDDWAPSSFLIEAEAIADASRAIDDELARHIAFAQEQVRGFARAQLRTLSDLEVETLPGVVLGHRRLPVRAVGAYVPGGMYPMLASSFMTVAVAKVAGVARVTACTPPRGGRGPDPVMLHAI